MKVMVFVDKPLPRERPTGIGVAAFNMSLALSRRGLTVCYVCRGRTDITTKVNERMLVRTLRNYSRGNLFAAISLVREEMPDIFHVHSAAAFPSLLLGRALGRGVVMHAHGNEPMRPLGRALTRKAGMDLSQRVIAISEVTRRDLIGYQGLSPDKIEVAYNGVDVDAFTPLERQPEILRKYGLEKFDRIMLSMGAIQRRKGQHTIIQSLPSIVREWPNLAYVNVGRPYDERYEARLEGEARSLGVLGNVKFLRDVPQGDLVALINSASFCLHPSSSEAFGLAVVEEMACARAVIAYDSGAMPEIIENGSEGLLVDPKDNVDLRQSMQKLLSDDELTLRLGRAAREKVVRKFTWDLSAERLVAIYRGLGR